MDLPGSTESESHDFPSVPQWLPLTWLGLYPVTVAAMSVCVATPSLSATAFSRCRSAREPITCPKIDAPMVSAIASFGITTDFLSMAMKGTAACTAANHDSENFRVCSFHTPKGTLTAMPMRAITSIFAGNGWGRKVLTRAVRARAALAATTAGGHLSFNPGGGWKALATIGRTPLTALYDFAIGQFPVSNQSFPDASCFDEFWFWKVGRQKAVSVKLE